MKKLTTILLLLMMLCTVACDVGKTTIVVTGPVETHGVLEDNVQKSFECLKAAAEKTKSANSFVLEERLTQKMGNQSMTKIDKYTVYVGENGTCTILAEGDSGKAYYSGKEGYEYCRDSYGDRTQKHIYTETVDLSALTDMISIPKNPNFLTDFCSCDPKNSVVEGGGVAYSVSDIPAYIFLNLVMGPDYMQEGVEVVNEILLMHDILVTLKIDKNGCLTEFSYSAEISDNGQTVEMLQTLTLSRLGEELEIKEPEFIKKINDNDTVSFHEGSYIARYAYDVYRSCYRFEVLRSPDYKSVNIPVYRVLSEVEGYPVKEVDIWTGWWEDVNLEKLVLPECIDSIRVSNEIEMENTECFLSCSRDSLKKNKIQFNVVGDEKPNSEYGTVKAVYYSGEWKDVNGVPVPNK